MNGPSDLVGKKVKIVACLSPLHGALSNSCICWLIGREVRICGYLRGNLYHIRPVARCISPKEFEALPQQPAEVLTVFPQALCLD